MGRVVVAADPLRAYQGRAHLENVCFVFFLTVRLSIARWIDWFKENVFVTARDAILDLTMLLTLEDWNVLLQFSLMQLCVQWCWLIPYVFQKSKVSISVSVSRAGIFWADLKLAPHWIYWYQLMLKCYFSWITGSWYPSAALCSVECCYQQAELFESKRFLWAFKSRASSCWRT